MSAKIPQKCSSSRSSTSDLLIFCHHREKTIYHSDTNNFVLGHTEILMFSCLDKHSSSISHSSSFPEKKAAGPFSFFQILFWSSLRNTITINVPAYKHLPYSSIAISRHNKIEKRIKNGQFQRGTRKNKKVIAP